MDRVIKPALYAKAGIPSYWSVETANEEVSVNAYRLDEAGGIYVLLGKFTDVIEVDHPWEIELRVDDITPRRFRRRS
jgi:hypothetical protein